MGSSEFGVGVGDAEVVLKGQHFSLDREPRVQAPAQDRERPFEMSPSTGGFLGPLWRQSADNCREWCLGQKVVGMGL